MTDLDAKHPRFGVGDLIALRADPERTGSVIAELSPVGGVPRYRVFTSDS